MRGLRGCAVSPHAAPPPKDRQCTQRSGKYLELQSYAFTRLDMAILEYVS